MKRREIIRHSALLFAGGLLATMLGQSKSWAQSSAKSGDIYVQCAKACAACEKNCAACNKHCTSMVQMGMKEHERSRQLSADCRELCGAAAKIVTRRGPLSASVCAACADACKACGAECGKYTDMPVMKACAASCAVCEKACRTMIAAAKGTR